MASELTVQPQPKVLIIAEAANPEWVSVPLVGWSMAIAIRDVCDAHIVTQIRNREAFLRAGLIEGKDFTAINSEKLARLAWRVGKLINGSSGKGWTTGTALASLTYFYFERLVWKEFGTRISAGHYEIVHRITPLSPTSPSPIARKVRRAGASFVLGPLNGGLPWPPGYDRERRKEREWLSYVRGAYKLLPSYRSTLKAASLILAGSRYTQSELPTWCREKTIFMPENGIDPSRFAVITRKLEAARGPLRLCFIGRLVPYKGADLALSAAAPLLRSGAAHFDVIGDGPMMAELHALVEREGITKAVRFHGWIPHDEVQGVAQENEVFVFPSVREFGGGAVIEAMALGLLPIVVNYGGPSELVENGRGIALPLASRGQTIANLKDALTGLLDRRATIRDMGAHGQEWVMSRLTWKVKAREMLAVYRWARDPGSEKPQPY